MAKPYSILNEIANTLSAEFVHGTDTEMVLTSAAAFDSGGGYVRVEDDDEWALYEYTGITTNTLTELTACTLGNVESTAAHTFAAGSAVELTTASEFVNDLRTDLADYTAKSLFDANTVLAADSDDTPTAREIAVQQIVGRITAGNIKGLSVAEVLTLIGVTAGADPTAANETSHADVLVDADFDANSILASDADDSPTVRTIAVQQLVGRITAGNIKGLTAAEVLTLIGVTAGADPTAANETSHADVLVDGDVGIADDKILQMDDADAESGDFLRLTANGPEGRSHAETLGDLSGDAANTFSWNDQILSATKGILATAEAELTIAAGVIAVTQLRHKVDTESDAASDDLATINGGGTVNMIIIRAEADDRTVVIKHNTGNIWLQGKADISLDDLEDGIMLAWDSTNSKWFDIAAGGGGTSGAVLESDFNAKGDILSASADDTPLILTVGADSTVLTANSSKATGLEWAAAGTPGAHKDTHDPEDGADPLDTAAAAEISAVVAAGVGSSHSLARADHVHAINHAITDNHLVTVDGTTNQPIDTDYAAWTANGLEGRDKTQMLAFLNVADGADVTGSNAPQAHKDSHDPNDGSDALDTAAAVEISAVVAAGAGTSHSLARADHIHAINHAITDNHIVTIDQADAATGEYAKFTANGLESKSVAEVLSDLSVASGADVTGSNAPQAHAASHLPAGGDPLTTAVAAEISAVVAAGAGVAESFAKSDHIHAISHAITNNHIVTVDGTTNQPVDTDYAAWTAAGLEGRDKTQMQTFMNVADGADVSTNSFAFFMS